MKTYYADGSITISSAYVCRGAIPTLNVSTVKYTLVGETLGSSSLSTALADANATYYDAMGVVGSMDLNPTGNPNALFKANSGVLANAKNVIVGSTCANLDLTDGNPFKSPIAFTATSVSYDRTLTADQTTTVCLPFALSTAEAEASARAASVSGSCKPEPARTYFGALAAGVL